MIYFITNKLITTIESTFAFGLYYYRLVFYHKYCDIFVNLHHHFEPNVEYDSPCRHEQVYFHFEMSTKAWGSSVQTEYLNILLSKTVRETNYETATFYEHDYYSYFSYSQHMIFVIYIIFYVTVLNTNNRSVLNAANVVNAHGA